MSAFLGILLVLAIILGIGIMVGKVVAFVAGLTVVIFTGITIILLANLIGFIIYLIKEKRYKQSLIFTLLTVLVFIIPFYKNLSLFGFEFNWFMSKCILLLPISLLAFGIMKYAKDEDNNLDFRIPFCFMGGTTAALIIYALFNLPVYNIMSKVCITYPEKITAVLETQKYDTLTHYDFLKDSLRVLKENGKEITRTNINDAISELGYRKSVNITCLRAELKESGLYYVVMFKDQKYFSFESYETEQQFFYVNPNTLEIFDQDMNKIGE